MVHLTNTIKVESADVFSVGITIATFKRPLTDIVARAKRENDMHAGRLIASGSELPEVQSFQRIFGQAGSIDAEIEEIAAQRTLLEKDREKVAGEMTGVSLAHALVDLEEKIRNCNAQIERCETGKKLFHERVLAAETAARVALKNHIQKAILTTISDLANNLEEKKAAFEMDGQLRVVMDEFAVAERLVRHFRNTHTLSSLSSQPNRFACWEQQLEDVLFGRVRAEQLPTNAQSAQDEPAAESSGAEAVDSDEADEQPTANEAPAAKSSDSDAGRQSIVNEAPRKGQRRR
jgi:hypothetical protein